MMQAWRVCRNCHRKSPGECRASGGHGMECGQGAQSVEPNSGFETLQSYHYGTAFTQTCIEVDFML